MTDGIENKWLTPSEVENILGMSKSSIYRWVDEGYFGECEKLPNGHVKIPREAVMKYK